MVSAEQQHVDDLPGSLRGTQALPQLLPELIEAVGPAALVTLLAQRERVLQRARLVLEQLEGDIAFDFAIQCSADHPWLKEHPEWFHRRPDGTLKYAENPPKRYQDIYNVNNWDSPDWRGLWEALLKIVIGWVDCGVKVFRVDNPHTKPFAFWT